MKTKEKGQNRSKREDFWTKSEKEEQNYIKYEKKGKLRYKTSPLCKKKAKKFKLFLKKLLFSVKENTKQLKKVNAFLKKEKAEKGYFFEWEGRKKEN